MKDTKYTSPDAIRDLYRNPKNVIRNVDDDNLGLSLVETSPALLPTKPSDGGGIGIGGVGDPGRGFRGGNNRQSPDDFTFQEE